MSRLWHLVSRDVVIRYYNVYIKPVIQYGVLIYGCILRNRLLPIYLQQKKLLRLIFLKSSRYHSSSLFEDSGIQNIYDIYTFELLKFSPFFDQAIATDLLHKQYLQKVAENFHGYPSYNVWLVWSYRSKMSECKAFSKISLSQITQYGSQKWCLHRIPWCFNSREQKSVL